MNEWRSGATGQQRKARTKAERRTRDSGGTRTREGKWKRNADAEDIPSYSPKQIKVRLEHCKRCARGLGWARARNRAFPDHVTHPRSSPPSPDSTRTHLCQFVRMFSSRSHHLRLLRFPRTFMDIRIIAYFQIERFRIVQLISRLASTHRPAQAATLGSRRPQPLAVWARFETSLPRFRRTCTVYMMAVSSFTTPCCRRQVLYSTRVRFLSPFSWLSPSTRSILVQYHLPCI